MKALRFLTLAAALTVAGCNDSNPTPPSNDGNNPPPQNTTTTTTFNLNLKTGNERPAAITGAEANATGTAVIKFNITKDPAFNIVSATVDFDVNVAGFPPGSAVNLAHIHTGDRNTAAGIIVNTELRAGEVVLTNGTGTFQKHVSADGSVLQNIISNPASFYFNVHSGANPGGVLRAQMDNTGVAGGADPGEPKPGDPTDPYYTPGRAR